MWFSIKKYGLGLVLDPKPYLLFKTHTIFATRYLCNKVLRLHTLYTCGMTDTLGLHEIVIIPRSIKKLMSY